MFIMEEGLKRCWPLPIFGYLLFLTFFMPLSAQKNFYYMDKNSDCGIGTYDVQRGQQITIHGRQDSSTSTQGACTMNFQAVDQDATLVLDFISFAVTECGKVSLYLSGDASGRPKSYGCSDRDPSDYYTIDRSITITLHKTDITNQNYNFQLQLTAVRENQFQNPDDSHPSAVGLVIGLVGGVFTIIIVVAIIGICCFRKYRARAPRKSPYLYDPNSKTKLDMDGGQSPVSMGFTNENMHGSPMSKRKLLAPSDSSDEKSDHGTGNKPRMSNYKDNNGRAIIPPPPPLEVRTLGIKPSENVYNVTDHDKFEKNGRYDERGVDVSSQPRNPMLNALKSNSKFKNTFDQTERDADQRAKRISSTSSFENLGLAPTPPSSNENLQRPTLPPVPKSPKSKSKQKTSKIGRNPQSNSFSSDDVKKGIGNDNSIDSSMEKVNEKSKKADTKHSLRPDRKGKKGGRNQSVSSTLDPEPRPSPRAPREKERVQAFEREINDNSSQNGSGRYSKRTGGRKSPRQQGRSSGGKGFSHRRGRSADPYDSRPTTPTIYGSMEDLESLPPLQRAGSKKSLYGSRTSLYDRRGRRRKGSYSESVVSYGTTRDDISVGRHSNNFDSYSDEDDFDGYEKPLSRRDRERMYRSDNDLGRRGMREISTQTLRETATQTGTNESVVMQPKMVVKKRKRSKSLSTAGTQTKKSEDVKSKKKVDKDSDVDTDGETKKKRKSRRTKSAGGSEATLKGKRSKSLDTLGVDETARKPKTKPKPAPRKSTSALKDNITGSKENLSDPNQNNPYYPQSEGFHPGYNPQGYPMVAPPGYPGQPPQGQYPYPANPGMPNYPPNSMPQQLPPMMNGTSVQPLPRGPKKSNWEMLCEMTDGQPKDDPMEVGSVASSVFTNNPSNYPAYPAPQTMGQPYYNGGQGYYPPPPPQYYQAPPRYPAYRQPSMRAMSVPDFMQDMSPSESSDDTQEREEKRQAAIDNLKQPEKTGKTKPKLTVQNVRTESIV